MGEGIVNEKMKEEREGGWESNGVGRQRGGSLPQASCPSVV